MKRPFYLVSFLSGVTVLIYQITWIKRFGHIFGLHILSVSVVLGTFMTGLALGSLLFGKVSDNKNAIRLFVILESGLAIFALLFQFLFHGLSELYTFIGNFFYQSVSLIHIIRFILSFLFLLVPSTLIGGTLPVLVKIVTRRIGSLGRDLSLLYALNNLGAVTGCLLAGFFLIKYAGISGSMFIAGMINIFNAVFIWLLFSSSSRETVPEPKPNGSDSVYQLHPLPRNILILLLIVFTVEGFTTLSFEVIWTRVFVEFSYDKTVYLYSVIIAAFICGLSLGGFIISRFINRLTDLVAFMGYLEIVIGLISVIQLYLAVLVMPGLIEGRELYSTWLNIPGREYVLIFIFIQLPVVLMGMTFPVVGRLYARDIVNLGEKIGIIGMLDTAGSIAGAFGAGFILLPLLGVIRSILLTALLNVILGLLVLGFHPQKKIRYRISVLPGVIIICFLLVVFLPTDLYFKTKIGKKPGEEIIYYDEAACGTVTIHRYPIGYTALSINGVLFAYNTADDLRSHRMLAYMPYFFHPEPEEVLVLGFGLGITAGCFDLEEIEKITVAEICPPVIKASARYFTIANHDVINNEKVEIMPEDGRAWLLTSNRKFDIITCDAIHPRYGNNLYTREYYELCREHLNEQGVICQWMPTNWMTAFEYKSLLKTFHSVFPDASLWYVNRGVTLAVGTLGPDRLNLQVLQERMKQQQVRDDLAEADIQGCEMLLARFYLNGKDFEEFCVDGEINTDDRPFVEYGKVISMAPNPEVLQSLYQTNPDVNSILSDWNEIKADTAGFALRLDYCRYYIEQELERNIEILKLE